MKLSTRIHQTKMRRSVPPPARLAEKEPASVASPPKAEAPLSFGPITEPSFRLTELMRKKRATSVPIPSGLSGHLPLRGDVAAPKERHAAPAPVPPPARPPAAPEAQLLRAGSATPSVAGGPAHHPVESHAQRVVKEPAPVASPPKAEAPTPPEAVEEPSFRLTELMRKKRAAPAPDVSAMAPGAKEEARDRPAYAGPGSAEAKAEAASATEAGSETHSRFQTQPAKIYEVARQLGIALPQNREDMINKAESCLSAIFKKIIQPSANEKMVWPMIKSIAADIEGIIADDPALLTLLHRHRVKRERLIWHSLYTSLLAMDLAQHTSDFECSLHEIGGGALLHDIGLLHQPDAFRELGVINGSLPDVKEHVAQGVTLARELEVPEIVITLIAQHRGRLDGQGYPPGLTPKTFLRASQIVAIANIFEHVILDNSTKKKEDGSERTRENGIAPIFNKYRGAFSLDLLKKMIALIGFYPVGSIVELNNRIIGEVVRQNKDFPIRPVVKVVVDSSGNHPETEQLIDLKQVKILSILCNIARPETP